MGIAATVYAAPPAPPFKALQETNEPEHSLFCIDTSCIICISVQFAISWIATIQLVMLPERAFI